MTRLTLQLAEGRDTLDEHLLPAFLARRHIRKARWTGELKTRLDEQPTPEGLRYISDFTLVPTRDHVELNATIFPATPPRMRAPSVEYDPFVERHGLIRYDRAWRWLANVDRDARHSLGIKRSTYRPRESIGPWEYLPSEQFVEWSIQARQVIECNPDSPALVDLMRSISLHPLLYGSSARLTVEYSKF